MVRRRRDALRAALLTWYGREKRDLPWRRTRDPYSVWVSEVMLQQTRVDTVIPYYERFLAEFPTVLSLADAPLEKVLARWSGLGYYRRARMLHAAAGQVARDHGGVLPRTAEGLKGLTGVGDYTAGAVASIAYGEAAPIVDGNVARILSRIFAVDEDVRRGAGLARVWQLATDLVPEGAAGDFNQAMMELGALVCAPREPRCVDCPARDLCDARAQGRERTLPVATAKTKVGDERRTALVLRHGSDVLLARRGAVGTFAGMWEPPSVVGDEDGAALLAAVGLPRPSRPSVVDDAGEVVHVLSHRRLQVRVLSAAAKARALPRRIPARLAGEYVALEWAASGALDDRPMTTFARKVLAKAR